MKYFVFAFYLFCAVSGRAEPALPTIDAFIEDTVFDDYLQFVAGRPIMQIDQFAGIGSRRDVVDMILVQQALILGDLPLQFNFVRSDFSARSPQLFVRGEALISFDSVWLKSAEQFSEQVYISSPVIERGDYMAAIFTSPNNKRVLNIKSLADFKGLTAVTSRAYHADWYTLQQLPLKKVRDEYAWHSMAILVSRGWIDFMLAPFPAERPFGYQQDGIKLVAVEGVKILLDDSRHFIVSKQHPLADATFAALQRGLVILRERGVLHKAYEECGFFNQHVAQWKILNPLNEPLPANAEQAK